MYGENNRFLLIFCWNYGDILKTFIATFFLLFVIPGYHAIARQDRMTDSLLTSFQTAKEDSVKAGILFLLSDHWADTDSARAVDYAKRSFRYTKDGSFQRGKAFFYLAGAYFSYDRKLCQQAYQEADKILSHFTSREALQYRSRAWHNYGIMEQLNDNNKGFVDILLTKAIPFAKAAGDEERVAWNYMDVGGVFMNYKNYNKAGWYYDKAIAILLSSKNTDKPVLAECYMSKAKIWLWQELPDSANQPLNQAFDILQTAGDSSYLPLYYQVRGKYHTLKEQWNAALEALEKGYAIAALTHREYDGLSIQYELYEVYKRLKKFDKAKQSLELVYSQYDKYPIAQNKRMFLYELAETETALGNYRAGYKRMQEYARLSDSVFTQNTGKEIADLEAKYRLAENEKKLLALQHRNELQQLLLYFGAVVLALLIAFFIYVYRQRKKREAQRLFAINQEQEIEITRAQLEGEERERKRLARELHDGLGGMLAGVKLNLSAVSHGAPATQQIELQKVTGLLDDSVQELRRIAKNMMPEALLRSGLSRALEGLCHSIGTSAMRVDYEFLNIPENIRHQEKVDIYRIVQELLANAVKHSGASDIFLQCSGMNDRFYITLEDNGKGMPGPEHIKEGLGLANIRSRVSFMHGKMEISSQQGGGTVINIEINVTKSKEL